jgi:hypothetical protein
LLRCGLVLPRNHLVLGEHLALPHSPTCHHCHFLNACQDAVVGKRGSNLFKASEVGRNAGCWILVFPVPLGLVRELLGGGHLDGPLLD